MKIKIIVAAISLSLAACVVTESGEQTPESVLNNSSSSSIVSEPTPIRSKEIATVEVSKEITPVSATHLSDIKITLEQIMSDPDWMGRSPERWYWGDDSQSIYYSQKQKGTPLRELYHQSISAKSSDKVALDKLHQASDRNAVKNDTGTQEVYTYQGNVFLKHLVTGVVTQLTHTTAYESSVMFLANGNVAYRVKDKFFEHDLTNNRIVELASLLTANDPKNADNKVSYLAGEQTKLIGYIALQQKNEALKTQQSDRLKAQNNSITQTEFYFGKGKRITHASLSPHADKMIVSIADQKSSRDDSDIMPNYVTDNGKVDAEKVRARVANNTQYKEQLYLLDLTSGQKFELAFDTLPGFDQDVLASVRKENFQREGKTYQSKKSPRNIHVMRANSPIKWHKSGKQVALLLEAWDNKDRWLTSVNLLNNTLENQHRLHDNAWINWSFNEFGWIEDKLYYLSEETGYSHLYTKSLKGKAKQLTSGKFEVNNVTLTNNKDRFIFRANKSHPGIYDIYQVNADGSNFTALTALGGNNDYALSPDESKLLIEHSTVTMPPELYVKDLTNDSPAKRITHTVSEQFLAMPWASPSVIAIPSTNQKEPIYSRVYLPKNYDQTSSKNKAVMFTHGAGYLQNAHLGWSGYFREFMFHSMLVQQGYVVIDMDYRASAGYGRDWRTAIYRHMGKPEVEDMRDGVNWLVENANVDRNRIGTYGGSYGGFLTLMSMFTAPDLFQSGSALRLVSDWAYYNHGYTSNILNTPEDDAIAYERSSPIYFAEGLEKPLLINAPMVDDNVFFQDTVRLVQRLIELEKQDFETAIYPVEPHGFVQPSSWLNEYRRIYKLFESTL
ncbi:S9 family peptidase [Thalassotalea piscium]|uniref:Dipeptidyl aminopeptidase/acylaminoacyl peptidase n=1 Tax=Thalassotalea piscium TaxID=1230533 RepID=A0A7X0NFG4_9GAMM|nr:prolyl oligopeptidase family serine peptidase [Thalassotalea piscium]MBB6542455.1 dipeptidyl aminopeptidase/acylaminoacyl peptidase [Thalassotalea piscium]